MTDPEYNVSSTNSELSNSETLLSLSGYGCAFAMAQLSTSMFVKAAPAANAERVPAVSCSEQNGCAR